MSKLTHLDASGAAHMVYVGDKAETLREARAEARVRMAAETLHLIESGGHKKGDVIAVARVAGIQAAKRCAEPNQLREAARDERRPGVRAETEAVGDPGSDGQHVLRRAADLNADDVVAGIGTETIAVQIMRHPARVCEAG